MATIPEVDVSTVADGSTTQFVIPFPFLDRADVLVTVDDAPVPYNWVSDGMVSIVPAPAAGAVVRRYRNTPGIEPIHQFRHGVPFLPGYIDDNNRQNLYVMQEAVYAAEEARIHAEQAYLQAKAAAEAAERAEGAASRSAADARAALEQAELAAQAARDAEQAARDALALVQLELGALPPVEIPAGTLRYVITVNDARRKLIAMGRCTFEVAQGLPKGFYCEVMRNSMHDVDFEAAAGTTLVDRKSVV